MKPVLCLCCLAAFVLGCADRTHLTPRYGTCYRAALVRQAVNPGAGENEPAPKGLDTQEAAVIAQSYRAGLYHKGVAPVQESALLQVSPSLGKNGEAFPAPSVPPDIR